MTLRLVRLDCAACGSSLRGEPHDVVFLCAHCGGGWVLGTDALEPAPSTALLPAPGRRAQVWKPGWLLETEVEVSNRVRAGGRRTPDWRGERRFVIPAFALPLGALTTLARALSATAGELAEVPREPVRGGVMSLDDARVFARFLVVSEEVARPDTIASLAVEVHVRGFRLAALPFEHHGDNLRCALTGTAL